MAVDLAGVAQAHHDDRDLAIADIADEAAVADAVLPQPPELGAAQGLAELARIG